MDTNMRPLTLGEILDRTAQLYRSNFLLFAGIFSFYAAISLVVNLAQLGVNHLVVTRHLTPLVWLSYAMSGLTVLSLVLLIGAVMAAVIRAVASVHLGEPISIRGAYASTLPRFGRYLWLSTITGFLAWWPVVVLYIGFFVTMFHYRGVLGQAGHGAATTPAQQQAVVVMGVIFLVFGLFALPASIYSFWMTLRYSLSVPACVVENTPARAAVRRSIELSKGVRGRIFLLLLLIGVIKLGVSALTQSFLFVAVFKNHGHIPVGLQVLSQCIAFFTTTVLGPIGAAGLTLFYFDQRVRKEGFDIERMMLAAGLEGAPASSPALGPSIAIAVPPAEPVHE